MSKAITLWGIFIIFLIAALFYPILFPIAQQQAYGKNKILIEYELVCGGTVTRVIRGGEEIAAATGNFEAGTNEVIFTNDSDTPLDHLNSGGFYTEGLARGFRYVVYGEVVGTAKGVCDCGGTVPVYNKTAPLFAVSKWAPTRWMPYAYYNNIFFGLTVVVLLIISIIGFIISFIVRCKHKKGTDF